MKTLHTTAPGTYSLLYDGHCNFCTAAATRFRRWMGNVAVDLLDFQQPGVLARFPGVTYDACMEAMQLVTPDGRVFSGAEAVVRGLATRRVLGALTAIYYVPGVRTFMDAGYRLVAKYRYYLMGKAVAAGHCDGGTCALHLTPRGEHAH